MELPDGLGPVFLASRKTDLLAADFDVPRIVAFAIPRLRFTHDKTSGKR
jgi:hypothetical protein